MVIQKWKTEAPASICQHLPAGFNWFQFVLDLFAFELVHLNGNENAGSTPADRLWLDTCQTNRPVEG